MATYCVGRLALTRYSAGVLVCVEHGSILSECVAKPILARDVVFDRSGGSKHG